MKITRKSIVLVLVGSFGMGLAGPALGHGEPPSDICADVALLIEAANDAADEANRLADQALEAANRGNFELADSLFAMAQVKLAEASALTDVAQRCKRQQS